MAVYTHLGAEDLARLIAHYDVGELVMAKGIAEGVSNSNWLVETTGRSGGSDNSGTRFILTLYERRIDYADLPYFLGLLDRERWIHGEQLRRVLERNLERAHGLIGAAHR